MKYNLVDTMAFDACFKPGAARPSDVALAAASCMPSVSNTGHGAKGGGLKRAGSYTSLYLAYGLDAVASGKPRVDADVFASWQAGASNKQNHQSGLIKWPGDGSQSLITVHGKPGTGQCVTLTPAGIEQVKAVGGAELAKLAKAAFSEAAYEAKARAEAKATSKPRKAKAVTPTADEAVESEVEVVEVVEVLGDGTPVVQPITDTDQPQT
jgi:hypothetical protein